MVDLVYEVNESADLGVVGVEVVVVDVENGVRVGLASCLKGDGDERLRLIVSDGQGASKAEVASPRQVLARTRCSEVSRLR